MGSPCEKVTDQCRLASICEINEETGNGRNYIFICATCKYETGMCDTQALAIAEYKAACGINLN